MGFERRYGFNPGLGVITEIEGVVIIRLAPPGTITGAAQGIVGMAAEFPDMTYALSVNTAGRIASAPTAVQIFGPQDLVQKTGGFDELIGNFGNAMGNGFVELRNKTFVALILVPVDFLTPSTAGQFSSGCRFWRELPTNQSATVALPIVPLTSAIVPAGYQLVDGSSNRVRNAGAFTFTAQAAYLSGTDGVVAHVGSTAEHNTFVAAGGNFLVNGVKVGDILSLGVIGGAGALGANAATYRVNTVTDATHLELELLAGTLFDFTAGSSLPWRLHVASTADSSGLANLHLSLIQTGGAGYLRAVRPLDASIAIDAALAPSSPDPAGTATSWSPLSGLNGRTNHITGDAGGNHSVIYDAALHAPNVANSATMDARYQAAIAAMLEVSGPASLIEIVLSARKSSTIRSAQRSHVLTASGQGLTRRALLAPELSVNATASVLSNTDPGVGAGRNERYDYAWPGLITSIPEAVGFSIAGADGSTVIDGTLDTTAEGWLAAVESNIPPENNPGQAAPPVDTVLAPVLGMQRGLVVALGINDYIALKAAGVCSPIFDQVTGLQFQSGVTTSLILGEQDIARCRMADFIEDSIAFAMKPFSKLNQTTALIESEFSEIDSFLSELKSVNNPNAQRIIDYSLQQQIDDTLEAVGVTQFNVNVRLLQSQKNLVLQTNIGMGVQITRQ